MSIRYNKICPMVIPLLLLGFVVTSDTSLCGLRTYDVDDSFCCNSQVHKRHVNGSDRECCTLENASSTIYDKNSKQCCNGQILDLYHRKTGQLLTCCGNNYMTDLSHECCNRQEYNPSIKYCCNDQIVLPKGRYCCTNAAGETHETDEPNINEKCCGTRLYNKTIQTCIKEQVHSISEDICGPDEHIYDKRLNVCCHETGEVLPLPKTSHADFVADPNYQCVNGTVVDQAKNPGIQQESCEDNTIIDSTMDDTRFCCDRHLTKIRAEFSEHVKCCGKKIIDIRRHKCCNGQQTSLLQTCCGGKVYNSTGATCCDGQLVDTARHVCCHVYSGQEKIIEKVRANDTACCGQSARKLKPFNHHDQCCINGELYEKKLCKEPNVSTSGSSLQLPNLPIVPRRSTTCPFCENSFVQKKCDQRFSNKWCRCFGRRTISHR